MKKVICAMLILMLIFSFMTVASAADEAWDGKTAQEFSSGSGTKDDPYIISSGAQLYYLSLNYNTVGSKYFKLANDIDLGDINFAPIESFSGYFDGAGYTISGLKIVNESGDNTGFIKQHSGTLSNLKLKGTVRGKGNTGAFVGKMSTNGTITNCINYCDVEGTVSVGGIIGVSSASSSGKCDISLCKNYGSIKGDNYVGGICGYAFSDYYTSQTTVSDSANYYSVTGKEYVGGIVGTALNGYVVGCANAGSVTATVQVAGGIAGILDDHYSYSIYSQNHYYPSKINNSYNCGAVTAPTNAGGIAGIGVATGINSNINYSYNAAVVTATSKEGVSSDICNGSFNTIKVYYLSGLNSGTTNPSSTIANDDAVMKTAAGFSGFDFVSVWSWDDTEQYPYPILKNIGVAKAACRHIDGDAVKENEVAATCKQSGHYDEVVYCSECGEEMSREEKTSEKLTTHTPLKPVREKEIAATCKLNGIYDEVVYCSVCDGEISREQKTTEKLTVHKPMDAVTENEVLATAQKEGSYEAVVYCGICKKELSRTLKTTEKLPEGDDGGNAEEVTGTAGVHTGDGSEIGIFIICLSLSIIGIVMLLIVNRKKNSSN